MSDVILVLLVELIVVHLTERLAPKDYSFIYGKTKDLLHSSGKDKDTFQNNQP